MVTYVADLRQKTPGPAVGKAKYQSNLHCKILNCLGVGGTEPFGTESTEAR